jgi:nitrogen fixation protein FixH
VRIPPNVFWPTVIIAALVIHVVVSLGTVWLATSNPSYAVEEDYYQKGLQWDAKRAQDRRNAELGWAVGIQVQPAAIGNPALLELTLTAADATAVEAARVAVETFHNARANEILRAVMEEVAGGRYTARLPMRRSGVWEFRITAVRGDDTFTFTETRYVSLDPRP